MGEGARGPVRLREIKVGRRVADRRRRTGGSEMEEDGESVLAENEIFLLNRRFGSLSPPFKHATQFAADRRTPVNPAHVLMQKPFILSARTNPPSTFLLPSCPSFFRNAFRISRGSSQRPCIRIIHRHNASQSQIPTLTDSWKQRF